MTEIPEHLLKRSKERRAALGDGSAPDDAPSTATPATVNPAVPPAAAKAATPAKAAPAGPPPPKPDPPYVAAAKSRKKIPFWAMATLSLLPIWGFMYVQGVKPPAKVVHGPIGDGTKLYTSAACSQCHGPSGGGGTGRQFSAGNIQLTFPHIEDQLNFVYNGSAKMKAAGILQYGDPNRPGGVRVSGSFGLMPNQGLKAGGALTDANILAAVCHERYDLGGADPASAKWVKEYTLWCAPDSKIYAGLKDGSITFENVNTKFPGVLKVGTDPRASQQS